MFNLVWNTKAYKGIQRHTKACKGCQHTKAYKAASIHRHTKACRGCQHTKVYKGCQHTKAYKGCQHAKAGE
jgi:hypothetical protein